MEMAQWSELTSQIVNISLYKYLGVPEENFNATMQRYMGDPAKADVVNEECSKIKEWLFPGEDFELNKEEQDE